MKYIDLKYIIVYRQLAYPCMLSSSKSAITNTNNKLTSYVIHISNSDVYVHKNIPFLPRDRRNREVKLSPNKNI